MGRLIKFDGWREKEICGVDGWREGRMDGWIERDGWMNGWRERDGRMVERDGWMNEWMEKNREEWMMEREMGG